MIKLTNLFLAAANALLIDVGNILEDGTLRLFTNAVDIDKDTIAADLTAPIFTGYTDQALTFTEATDAAGRKYLTAGPITDTPTNATNLPMSILGAGIIGAGGELVCAGLFAAPLLLTFPGQQIHVTPKVILGDSPGAIIEGYVE